MKYVAEKAALAFSVAALGAAALTYPHPEAETSSSICVERAVKAGEIATLAACEGTYLPPAHTTGIPKKASLVVPEHVTNDLQIPATEGALSPQSQITPVR